jgi:hypothetical protein
MKHNKRKEQRQVCRFILGYLLEHPEAGDTLDGIVEWWLLKQKIRFETLVVSQAIADLVAAGLIVIQSGPDSRIIYRANRSNEKMQAMLNEMRDSDD